MSLELISRVQRYAPVRGADRSLLLKLADEGDEASGIASFRLDRLSRLLEVTPGGVEEMLARLMRQGLLSAVPDAEIPIPIAWREREPGLRWVRINVEAPPPGALLH